MSSKDHVASPCISVCLLNEKDVCIGCYRNTEEIADWHSLSNDKRKEIVLEAELRRKANTNIFLS